MVMIRPREIKPFSYVESQPRAEILSSLSRWGVRPPPYHPQFSLGTHTLSYFHANTRENFG